MKKPDSSKRRLRLTREEDKHGENSSSEDSIQKKSQEIATDSSGVFSASPVKLGISIRRVKDCEKPKNRWIKAEKAQRSEEVVPEPCYTSSIVMSTSSNSILDKSLNENATYTLSSNTIEPLGNIKSNNKADDSDCSEQPISLKIRINRTSSTSSSLPRVVDSVDSQNSSVPNLPQLKQKLNDHSKFIIGDVVWSKLAGWPYWPAVITELKESNNQNGKLIATLRWFAWNQVSFMECEKLVPFLEEYEKKYNKNRKGAAYHQAVKEAFESVSNGQKCDQPEIEENKFVEEVDKTMKKTRRKRKDNFDPPKRKKRVKTPGLDSKKGQIKSICPTSGELPSFSNPLEILDALSDEDNEEHYGARFSVSDYNGKSIVDSSANTSSKNHPALSVSITPPIDVVNISSSTCDDNTPTYSANGTSEQNKSNDEPNHRQSSSLEKIIPKNDVITTSPGSPRRKIVVDIPTFSEAESEDDLINSDLNSGRLIIDQDDKRNKTPLVSNFATSLVQNSINSLVRNDNNKADRNTNSTYENNPYNSNSIVSGQNPPLSNPYYNYQGSTNTNIQLSHLSNGPDYLYNRISNNNNSKKLNSLNLDGELNRTTTALVHTAFGTYSRPHHAPNSNTIDHFPKTSFQQLFHQQHNQNPKNQPKS